MWVSNDVSRVVVACREEEVLLERCNGLNPGYGIDGVFVGYELDAGSIRSLREGHQRALVYRQGRRKKSNEWPSIAAE